MSYITYFGNERMRNASIKDIGRIAKVVEEELKSEGVSIIDVFGGDPNVYIGGVAREISRDVHSKLESPHNIIVEDSPNEKTEVSDVSSVIFEAIK